MLVGMLHGWLEHPSVYRRLQSWIGEDDVKSAFLRHLRPVPGERMLDIGCGPGDILRRLPALDYHGVDLNPDYIAAAQARFGARGSFRCCSVADYALEHPGSFDVVVAHGLIHHLDDAEATRLFAVAAAAMKPGGRFITLDGCYAVGQSPVAKMLLDMDRGRFVRDRAGYESLARTAFADVRGRLYHGLMRLPYSHLVLECRSPRAEAVASLAEPVGTRIAAPSVGMSDEASRGAGR